MKIKIVLRSHLSKGQIIINGTRESLSMTDYLCEFDPDGPDSGIIASVSGMPPGIKKGIELVCFDLNGRNLFDIPHLSLKDFCVFRMKDNPYVSNETIAERNIVFNGDLVLSLDREKVFWFPFHYSERPDGFVYGNNQTSCENDDGCYHGEKKEHLDTWSNLPFHGIDLSRSTKVAVGCSVTYGTGVSKSHVWPTLLGFTNMGVPAVGIDAIYYNLETLLNTGTSPEQVIILFPSLERRLARFERDGMHFRIPIVIHGGQSARENNFFWADQNQLQGMADRTRQEAISDTENLYSKGFMDKIARLPISVAVSSWSKDTYQILPHYFERVLPFFEVLDDANDDPPHPGPLSHRKWAEKIQKLGYYGA